MKRLFLCVVCIFAAGCLSRGGEPLSRYLVRTPSVLIPSYTAVEPAPGVSTFTLAMRPLRVARPYLQKIAYLDEGSVLGQYENHEWAEPPGDTMMRGLADALSGLEIFADVGSASEMAKPDFLLTGELRQFYLDRTRDPWVACCELRLELRQGLGRAPVWNDTLSAEAALASNEVTALPASMEEAVSSVITQGASAIKDVVSRIPVVDTPEAETTEGEPAQ